MQDCSGRGSPKPPSPQLVGWHPSSPCDSKPQLPASGQRRWRHRLSQPTSGSAPSRFSLTAFHLWQGCGRSWQHCTTSAGGQRPGCRQALWLWKCIWLASTVNPCSDSLGVVWCSSLTAAVLQCYGLISRSLVKRKLFVHLGDFFTHSFWLW